MKSLFFETLVQTDYRYTKYHSFKKFADIYDQRREILLEFDKLKIEKQIEPFVHAATATVKDVSPSPRKNSKQKKQQAAYIVQGLATPPSGNRRKNKMEFKNDKEELKEAHSIEFVAYSSRKRRCSRSPSLPTDKSNKRQSKIRTHYNICIGLNDPKHGNNLLFNDQVVAPLPIMDHNPLAKTLPEKMRALTPTRPIPEIQYYNKPFQAPSQKESMSRSSPRSPGSFLYTT